MMRDAILNTSDETSVAMRPFSQFTVIAISFLNVFHQSMQQKYIFIRKSRTTSSCTVIDRIRAIHADVRDYFVSQMDTVASEGVRAMLRKTMIVLTTAAALTGALSADAFARGGGGPGGGGGHMGGGGHIGGGFAGGHIGGARMGGGFAGGHIGGGFGGARMGGGFGGAHMGGRFGGGFAGRHFARTRADFGHFHHDRRFDHHRRFSGGWDNGLYDYGCSYGYPYYNPYSCYPSAY
jgi:hypothetical protein